MTKHVPANTTGTALALPTDFIDFEGRTDIPAATLTNARIALSKLEIEFSHDLFRNKKYAGGMALNTDIGGQVSDEALSALRIMIRDAFRSPEKITHGMRSTCFAANTAITRSRIISIRLSGMVSNGSTPDA
jgi:hypothetical protein